MVALEGPTAMYTCVTLTGLSVLSEWKAHQIEKEMSWGELEEEKRGGVWSYFIVQLYEILKKKNEIFIVCQIVFLYQLNLKF